MQTERSFCSLPEACPPEAHPSSRDAASGSLNTGPVFTYPVFMNVTISVDDQLLERARELARRRGVSLQELIREQLRLLAGTRSGADAARDLLALMEAHGGHSGGRTWSRGDAYADRL